MSNLRVCLLTTLLVMAGTASGEGSAVFPGDAWEHRDPGAMGLDTASLEATAGLLGGRGCVVKDGYVVHAWGDQAAVGDWMSAAKPVLSTLLFFAVEEGLVDGVDQPVADFGWDLKPRHQGMTFRHLGAMSSGYARPEGAGEAWVYNDYAIQLYQKTLFEKVFQAHGNEVAAAPDRLGALDFEDGLRFSDKHRLKASVRDFARIAWFWCQHGRWGDRQLLPRRYFDAYMRPQTPKDLPQTADDGHDEDYLGIGSYGGGSDHFSDAGPGIYGFNWWFNETGRLHPDEVTWPGAPVDTVMAIGAGGNCAAFIPSLDAVLVCAEGDWGKVDGGNGNARMNRVLTLFARACGYDPRAGRVTGTREQFLPLTVTFPGPTAKASDTDPFNPFLDFRLQVTFTAPSGRTWDVPGFFAGDGQGGLEGGCWRVVFTPDEVGQWTYTASFRTGPNVAISLERDAGEAVYEGLGRAFEVAAQEHPAPGFYRWGHLQYAGGHYLKFSHGPYWLKGGTDSPEDLLAYAGFHGVTDPGHAFAAHVPDWREGDPDWDDGAGRGIIGALNYLAAQGVNGVYFLPMNIGGDGKNAHPWLEPIDGKGSPDNDNLHFDLARLRQWGIVFDHAQRQGIMLHFVLNEAEEPNKRELDDATLGVERKLFYRELAARFGHLPALQWNLCEEYNLNLKLDPAMVKSWAAYLDAVDPWDHPITVHHAGNVDKAWDPFLGDPRFTVTSFQVNHLDVVERWREKSRAAGHPLVIGMDEYFPDRSAPDNFDRHRKEYLWPIYCSGGQVEFILDELLKTEDFRVYEPLWRSMAIARRFLQALPFHEMEPADGLLSGAATFEGENNTVPGQVFMKPGACYVVYLPRATETGVLDLGADRADYALRWFDPRAGVFVGEGRDVRGGGAVPLGPAPGQSDEDWAVLLTAR